MAGCAMSHQQGQHSLTCDFRSNATPKEIADRAAFRKEGNLRRKNNKYTRNQDNGSKRK
jgi:hypothetical protein